MCCDVTCMGAVAASSSDSYAEIQGISYISVTVIQPQRFLALLVHNDTVDFSFYFQG